MRTSLSPLNKTRPFPFLEEKNLIEFWEYLCCIDPYTGKTEGLLIFIKDLYNVLITRKAFWSDELRLVSGKLYESLLNVTDKLHALKDTYQANLINIDEHMFALSEAIQNIPINSEKKDNGYTVIENDDEIDEDTKEKILRYARDYIISRNLTIRSAFGIESLKIDILVHPFFMKFKLKEICGQDVSFKEIEVLVRKLMSLTKKKEELAAVVGIQLGQPGHIRTRHSAKLHLQHTEKFREGRFTDPNYFSEDAFNFREFEVMMKNALAKAGFKPPIVRRERVLEEEKFEMNMDDENLSKGTLVDFQHFIKCYWEFLERYRNVDEIQDLAKKILQKFNIIFIQGIKQRSTSIELKEYNNLKIFIRNLMSCIHL